MQRLISILLVLCAVCVPIACAAQNVDGYFDTSFAGVGYERVDVTSSLSDKGQVLRIQPDGKLLMAGTCGVGAQNFPAFCATRLRANGSYDNGLDGFGPGRLGYVSFANFQDMPQTVLGDMQRLGDGRYLFLGTVFSQILLAVLTADGSSLDSSAAGGAGYLISSYHDGVSGYARVLLVEPDGKILVAGDATGPNGNEDMAIKRFMPDFSVDTGFGNAGYQTIAFDLGGPSGSNADYAYSVAVQSDGRIVLAGTAGGPAISAIAIARLLPNGQPDPSFGQNQDGRATFVVGDEPSYAAAARIDAQGRIVLVGYIQSTTEDQCLIDRLLTDGSQDPSFNAGSAQSFLVPIGGFSGGCQLFDLAVNTDGTILAVGSAINDAGGKYFTAARLTPNGELDSSFGIGGKSYGTFSTTNTVVERATSVAIGNGGLMIGGYSIETSNGDIQFGIAKLTLTLHIFANGFEN